MLGASSLPTPLQYCLTFKKARRIRENRSAEASQSLSTRKEPKGYSQTVPFYPKRHQDLHRADKTCRQRQFGTPLHRQTAHLQQLRGIGHHKQRNDNNSQFDGNGKKIETHRYLMQLSILVVSSRFLMCQARSVAASGKPATAGDHF